MVLQVLTHEEGEENVLVLVGLLLRVDQISYPALVVAHVLIYKDPWGNGLNGELLGLEEVGAVFVKDFDFVESDIKNVSEGGVNVELDVGSSTEVALERHEFRKGKLEVLDILQVWVSEALFEESPEPLSVDTFVTDHLDQLRKLPKHLVLVLEFGKNQVLDTHFLGEIDVQAIDIIGVLPQNDEFVCGHNFIQLALVFIHYSVFRLVAEELAVDRGVFFVVKHHCRNKEVLITLPGL